MVEEHGTERPSFSTEGIENGDTVVLGGGLKKRKHTCGAERTRGKIRARRGGR